MSVLNQSGEEQVECPLCMEPLEVDDLNFYPCTCGYQICRFCWHRIRTDENGLCPACRKAYSENPADFIPLSQEQVAKLKAEKRQRDQQRKAKLSESRKHLASVRVVQKNLVFVVGLPMRLADPEVLKRHEYFGKFGKIHKVVINQSTSYAGSQGPSASAYVTYMKSDDALRAIQSVNNITIDGRLIKSSLGTTKYCSHFMKNQPCPKPDCMYLHDFGDPEASFTKEQMHAGKHQEYEKKLHDQLVQRAQQQQNQVCNIPATHPIENGKPASKSKEPPTTSANTTVVTSTNTSISSSSNGNNSQNGNSSSNGNGKDTWPQLNNSEKEKTDKKENSKEKSQKGKSKSKTNNTEGKKEKSRNCENTCQSTSSCSRIDKNDSRSDSIKPDKTQNNVRSKEDKPPSGQHTTERDSVPPKLPTTTLDDNSSFFSQNSFQKVVPPPQQSSESDGIDTTYQPILTDSMPSIDSTEDWMAAFGFTSQKDYLDSLMNVPKTENNSIIKDTLETFTNGYTNTPFRNQIDHNIGKPEYNRFYDMFKVQDSNRLEGGTYKNGYSYNNKAEMNHFNNHNQQKVLLNHRTQSLNIDQMSKLLLETAQKYGPKKYMCENGQNGSVHYPQYDNLMFKTMQTQEEIEEQLLQLSLSRYCDQQKAASVAQPKPYGPHSNGVVPQHPINGTRYNPHSYQNGLGHSESAVGHEEDELDFDPIHETQKGFAELMGGEHNPTQANRGFSSVPTNQMNGISHNHSSLNHIPPPPPGFVQPNSHMNSFGSKILPFLNMASSQQPQLNGTITTQGNWSNAFTQFQQQQQQQQQMRPQPQPQLRQQQFQQQSQHKNINNCHDWKTLDPAILSSSRHLPLANMPPAANYTLQQQLESQQQNSPLRYFDYNNFSHINTQQNLNWFTSELNSQINSPPGFRNTQQATKQQEC